MAELEEGTEAVPRVGPDAPFRTLALVSQQYFPPYLDEIRRLEAAGESPRNSLMPSALNADLLHREYLDNAPAWRRRLYALLPLDARQIIEALASMHRYDAVFSWGAERVGLPFAVLRRLWRSDVPFVAQWTWISAPSKAALLRLAQADIDRIILPAVQADYAVKVLGIPAGKVVRLAWAVDQQFWRPPANPAQPPPGPATDMICSAGREMRDFRTLVQAVDGLGIPCHIAAKPMSGKHDAWVGDLRQGSLPANVTMGRKTPTELRSLYARSRFVVLPLLETDTDNGVSVMLEAMAMGKAVICSRTRGQVGVLEEGKTGIFVPVGDATALREAIQRLWSHPDEAARMGEVARARIERDFTLDGQVAAIQDVVAQAVRDRRDRRGRTR